MKVDIIGLGPGTNDYLLPVARRAIENADCLIGAKRLLSLFSRLEKEELFTDGHLDKVIPYIKKYGQKKKLAMLVSGDPGMYSLLGKLSCALSPKEYTVIPGISTVQLAFARIGETYSDAKIISLHGRRIDNLRKEIEPFEKIFLFTDANLPANKIAGKLLEKGLENRRAVVLENIAYPDEKIIDTDLKALSRMKIKPLSVMIIKGLGKKAKAGKLYGIGIGPGEPGLITLKAKEILDRVDTVFVPKSGDDATSLARSIVEAATTRQKNFRELTFPMTKNRSILNRYWKRASGIIVQEINQGKEAAFVTIGDPFIYSTYVYLLKTMRENFPRIEVETIPGVSSFCAAASAAGCALVEGNERLAVVPVTPGLKGLKEALAGFDTVVLMKVGSKLRQVLLLLKEMDLVKRSILISRVGHKDQRIIRNLTSLRDKKAGYLSVIIVKKGRG